MLCFVSSVKIQADSPEDNAMQDYFTGTHNWDLINTAICWWHKGQNDDRNLILGDVSQLTNVWTELNKFYVFHDIKNLKRVEVQMKDDI